MIIAQTAIAADHWQAAIVIGGVASALVAGTWYVIRMIQSQGRAEPREITPQPLEVKGAARFVTTEECKLSHESFDNRLSRSERDIAELRVEVRTMGQRTDDLVRSEVGKVHDRTNDILESLAELRGEFRKTFERSKQ